MLNRVALALAFASLPLAAARADPQPTSANPDPHSHDWTQVTLDQDKARKLADDFARCAASRRPRQAAAALALPYGSDVQAKLIDDLAAAEGDCWGSFAGSGLFTSDSSLLAAGMAEYFLANPGRIDDARRRAPQAFAAREAVGVETFGDCVVEQNSAAVEALVRTDLASPAESAAEDALAPHLAACITEGHTLSLDRTALRQLLAVSLYRRVAIPPATPRQ
jgi:hypothetical protein